MRFGDKTAILVLGDSISRGDDALGRHTYTGGSMSIIEQEHDAEVPVVAPMTKELVLLHAANILDEFDWRQGSAGSREEGSMCAVSAIYEATIDLTGSQCALIGRAACAIDGFPAGPSDGWPLAEWNDAPGRTKAEVVARLREAAARVLLDASS